MKKTITLFALVLLIAPLASAREFKAVNWSFTLKYSNAKLETFDRSVLTLRGRAVYSVDDDAYCIIKLNNGIELPCQVGGWGYRAAGVPPSRIRTIAENTIGNLNALQRRTLEIFELGAQAAGHNNIGIIVDFGYAQPVRFQFHDPASNFESVHWVTNSPTPRPVN